MLQVPGSLSNRDSCPSSLILDLLFLCRLLDDFFRGSVAIHQGWEVLRLERILTSRFLPGRTQGDIHPAVVGQDEGLEFFQSLLPLFFIQLRILLYQLLDLIGRQVLIVA